MLPAEQSYFSIFFFSHEKNTANIGVAFSSRFLFIRRKLFNKIAELATAQNKIQIITWKKQPSRD